MTSRLEDGNLLRILQLRHAVGSLALFLCSVAGGCAHVGPDVASLEGGDGRIYTIDHVRLPKPGTGSFEIKPGPHTFDVTAEAVVSGFLETAIYKSGLVTLCVKARGGHRYKVKAVVKDDEINVFVVDLETGAPPKTPCGPDEEGD